MFLMMRLARGEEERQAYQEATKASISEAMS
jgi:hypothetical protein